MRDTDRNTSNPNTADLNGIDLAHLQTWIGREQVVVDDLSPHPARALSAALERPGYTPPLPVVGDALPPAWQWLYFVDTPSRLQTGADGHPRTGGFLPPVPLPRRMWAAGHFTVHAPLVLGTPAEKHSVVSHVDLKQGSSGTLVFVTVTHTLRQGGQVCIDEEQNLVYRAMPTAPAPLPVGESAPLDADWRIAVQPDPVLLFRFSALTYNGHRIHYDRPYAIEQEFYPALVVHGPLQATLLADSVRAHCPGCGITDFRFRAQRPLFDTDTLWVCGKRAGDRVALWTESHDGFIGMTATAVLTGAVGAC
jgi:3-methylfumaryl-CoA hydratase